jgi:hypothetical protein
MSATENSDRKSALSGAAEAAYDRAREDVRAIGETAKESIADYAEVQKSHVSEGLQQFAAAVQRASEELRENDQTMAGQVVREAADGLSQLSKSIGGSTAPELLDSVRRFGRDNPAAFIGGAVLAGLALGRFMRSSTDAGTHTGPESWPSRSASPYPDRPSNYAQPAPVRVPEDKA